MHNLCQSQGHNQNPPRSHLAPVRLAAIKKASGHTNAEDAGHRDTPGAGGRT